MTDFAVSITPNPTGGSCNGGQCVVNSRSCMIASTTNTICTFTITELEHGIPYIVNVRASNCNGESDATSPLSITIVTTSESLNNVKNIINLSTLQLSL